MRGDRLSRKTTTRTKAAKQAKERSPGPTADSPATAPVEPLAAADAVPAEQTDDERRQEAVELIGDTVEALVSERGAEEKIWGSMVKQALKRRRPGFAESYYGFRSFNGLLEATADAGAVTLERDDKSGGYLVRLAERED